MAPSARGNRTAKRTGDTSNIVMTEINSERLAQISELWLRPYENRGFMPREVVLYRFGATEQP